MQCKQISTVFENNSDNVYFQGAVATTLTQPLDVLKTRAMNANPGEFSVCMKL
jgi:hypothetical protein